MGHSAGQGRGAGRLGLRLQPLPFRPSFLVTSVLQALDREAGHLGSSGSSAPGQPAQLGASLSASVSPSAKEDATGPLHPPPVPVGPRAGGRSRTAGDWARVLGEDSLGPAEPVLRAGRGPGIGAGSMGCGGGQLCLYKPCAWVLEKKSNLKTPGFAIGQPPRMGSARKDSPHAGRLRVVSAREVVFLGARHVGSGVSWDLNLSSTTCQLGTLGPSEPSDSVSSSVKRGH